MLILGIETSCDECAAAVVKDGDQVLSSVVASQIEVHKPFGGVVPEIASRKHLETIVPVVSESMEQAGVKFEDLDAIAVTQGPGLMGALLVGLNFAKALSYSTGKPFIGVNHVQAHVSSIFLCDPAPQYPFIGLVVSGGHSSIYQVKSMDESKVLGATIDDAPGEAFDKVAKMLGLSYPGGVSIDKLSGEGDRDAFKFPRPMMHRPGYDFSFSGLKTAVLNLIHKIGEEETIKRKADIAASFQEAVCDVLCAKALKAAQSYSVKRLVLAGGVAANSRLREMLRSRGEEQGVDIYMPPMGLCTDNAAMIAAAGFHSFKKGETSGLELDGFSTERKKLNGRK